MTKSKKQKKTPKKLKSIFKEQFSFEQIPKTLKEQDPSDLSKRRKLEEDLIFSWANIKGLS